MSRVRYLVAIGSLCLAMPASASAAGGAPTVTVATDQGSLTMAPSGPPLCAIPGPPEAFAPDPPPTTGPPCAAFVPGGNGRQLTYSASPEVRVQADQAVPAPLVTLYDQSGAVAQNVQATATGPTSFSFNAEPGPVSFAMFVFPYDDGRWTGQQIYDLRLEHLPTQPPAGNSSDRLTLRTAARTAHGRVRVVFESERAGQVQLKWTAAGKSGKRTVRATAGRRTTVMLAISRHATRAHITLTRGKVSATRSFNLR